MIVSPEKPILDILRDPEPSLVYQGDPPQPGDNMLNNPHSQRFANSLIRPSTSCRYELRFTECNSCGGRIFIHIPSGYTLQFLARNVI